MSERHDDLTALRRAFAALPAVPPDPAACPPAERLLAAAAGELPPAELRDLVEHVAVCPACAEDWRLAVALEHPAGEAPEATYSPATILGHRRFRRVAAWCASAAAAAALFIAVLLPQPHNDRTAAWRGVKNGPKLSSLETCSRESCLLGWSEMQGATYDLEVTAARQSVVRAARLQATQYRIPPDRLAAIPAGAELTWKVTANLPDGHQLSSSPGRFVLR